jgi:hypothetical protein
MATTPSCEHSGERTPGILRDKGARTSKKVGPYYRRSNERSLVVIGCRLSDNLSSKSSELRRALFERSTFRVGRQDCCATRELPGPPLPSPLIFSSVSHLPFPHTSSLWKLQARPRHGLIRAQVRYFHARPRLCPRPIPL